jgi:hypothetical protein
VEINLELKFGRKRNLYLGLKVKSDVGGLEKGFLLFLLDFMGFVYVIS